jgi:hypothetical protein
LSQMKNEQTSKHVRCEGGIEHECPDYLTLYVVAHDEVRDELESHEQNDPEQVELPKDCIAEVCTTISENGDGTAGRGIVLPETLNRVKPPDGGNNAKSRIQANNAQRIDQSTLQR